MSKNYLSLKKSYPIKEYFGGAFSLYGALKCAPCRPPLSEESSLKSPKKKNFPVNVDNIGV